MARFLEIETGSSQGQVMNHPRGCSPQMTCFEDLKVGNRCVAGGSTVRRQSSMEHLQGRENPQTSAKSNLTPTAPVVTYDKSPFHSFDPDRDGETRGVWYPLSVLTIVLTFYSLLLARQFEAKPFPNRDRLFHNCAIVNKSGVRLGCKLIQLGEVKELTRLSPRRPLFSSDGAV
jgi:hypothetical protein